jgi:F0F1-type ATP synthase membrane subunit c/vacuolar-type H+-ATPase subunit K
MAISISGGTRNYQQLEEIQGELYQDSKTFRENVIDIQDGFKSGTDVYESKVTVAMTALNTGKVVATGNITLGVQKTPVSLVTFNYEDVIDDNTLKGYRFETSMNKGAFNNISDEFDRKVLIEVTPAIGDDLETKIWNGATAATKVSVAALTPGAGQGSITAAAQTAVAAMPTTLFDSILVTTLYNNSMSKTVPGAGLGDYIKVTGTTVTSTNIAAEYAKLFAGSPQKVVNNTKTPPMIFAPLSDRQLIKVANNAVGSAQQVNFLVEGSGATEKISYNGIEIYFVPLGATFRILTIPKFLKLLMDLVSDMSSLMVDRVSDGAMQRYIKNIQTIKAWVTNQRYITVYGG